MAALLSPFWDQATAILHYLGIDNICMWMSVDNEEISLAVCNLLQTITDCLLGQGKEEQHGKEEAVVLGKGKKPGGASVLLEEMWGEQGGLCSWDVPLFLQSGGFTLQLPRITTCTQPLSSWC